MMGRQNKAQSRLFYSFSLQEHVPADHLLRRIERFLDLGKLHEHLARHYASTGRPSIDPELLVRMLIVGYCFGIRSERRLCEEIHLNLAYRWFVMSALTTHRVRHKRSRRGAVDARCVNSEKKPGVGFVSAWTFSGTGFARGVKGPGTHE